MTVQKPRTDPWKAPLAAVAEEAKKALDSLQAIRDQVQLAESKLASLEQRFAKLEFSAPQSLRRLDLSTVQKAVTENPYAEFEVLEAWGFAGTQLPAGRVLRADHYPQIVDYVRAGLSLGLPQSQEAAARAYAEAAAQQRASEARAVAERKQAAADQAAAEAREASQGLS